MFFNQSEFLTRSCVHPRQPVWAAHAGELATLLVTPFQIIFHLPGALHPLPNFLSIRSEVALDGVAGVSLDRVPVLACTPRTKKRGAPEFRRTASSWRRASRSA